MESKRTEKRTSQVAIIIILVVILTAAWLIVTRARTGSLIEPSNSTDTSTKKGIPPDSLHH